MRIEEAVALIRGAVAGQDGAWADLGAGEGMFTRALSEILGAASRIYAVDLDRAAVAELEAWAGLARGVQVIRADFTTDLALPSPLDGMMFANSLHFIPDAGAVLHRLTRLLRPGGRVVLVEYDARNASRWVPYPIPIAALPALAAEAGLTPFTVSDTRPSKYQGVIYAAYADRL